MYAQAQADQLQPVPVTQVQYFDDDPAAQLGGLLQDAEERDVGVLEAVDVVVGEQGDHADEAGDGEDADTGRSLLPNVDLTLRYVVADRQGRGDADPGWQQHRGVVTASQQVDGPARDVEVDACQGKETHDGRLGRVVEQPTGHEAVGEDEG